MEFPVTGNLLEIYRIDPINFQQLSCNKKINFSSSATLLVNIVMRTLNK